MITEQDCYWDPHCAIYAVFVINYQYSVAQMCTREDGLTYISGAPPIDEVMSYNSLDLNMDCHSDHQSRINSLMYYSLNTSQIIWFTNHKRVSEYQTNIKSAIQTFPLIRYLLYSQKWLWLDKFHIPWLRRSCHTWRTCLWGLVRRAPRQSSWWRRWWSAWLSRPTLAPSPCGEWSDRRIPR